MDENRKCETEMQNYSLPANWSEDIVGAASGLNNEIMLADYKFSVCSTRSVKQECKNQCHVHCVRKGDNIYYRKPENIINMKSDNTTSRTVTPNTFVSAGDRGDNISSGESLYKTFTFDENNNSDNIEKCVEFWRSVMEKNLEPVKCSVVRNQPPVKLQPQTRDDYTSIDDTLAEENKRSLPDSFKNMWSTALKEIQRKKLHEVKLIGKSRCKMCESISSIIEDDTSKSVKIMDKEIIDLNNWVSQAKKKTPAKRTSGPAQNLKSHKSSVPDSSATKLRGKEMKPEDSRPRKIKPTYLKPDTNTYEHVDVIEEKKKQGAYSKWRSNKVTCTCHVEDCTCNVNPAIIELRSTPELTGPKLAQQSSTSIGKRLKSCESICVLPRLSAACDKADNVAKVQQESVLEEQELCRRESSLLSATPWQISKGILTSFKGSMYSGSVKKTLSIMMRCTCGYKNCDCGRQTEVLSPERPTSDEDLNLPPRPPVRRISCEPLKPVSSLELLHKKYSAMYQGRRSVSEDNIKPSGYGESIKDREMDVKNSSGLTEQPPDAKSSITFPEIEKNETGQRTLSVTSTTSSRTGKGILSLSRKGSKTSNIKKTLSVLLRCTCGHEECDCGWLKEVLSSQRAPFEEHLIAPPPTRSSTQKLSRVSSLEILHKKYSSASAGKSGNDFTSRLYLTRYSEQVGSSSDIVFQEHMQNSTNKEIRKSILKVETPSRNNGGADRRTSKRLSIKSSRSKVSIDPRSTIPWNFMGSLQSDN